MRIKSIVFLFIILLAMFSCNGENNNIVNVFTAFKIDSGGAHNCSITEERSIYCWGLNLAGQLGNGNHENSNYPVSVTNINSEPIFVSAGPSHTCLIATDDTIKCWGNNMFGQLGEGTNKDSNVPVEVMGLSNNIQSLSCGCVHTCAITLENRVKCWGRNNLGQLGDGSYDDSNVPENVVIIIDDGSL